HFPCQKIKYCLKNYIIFAEELKSYGVQEIFVLCTRGELSKCRVPNLLAAYQDHGFIVHHHPIPDGEAPDFAQCSVILNELRSSLEYNRKTLIHCYGGLGRSCLIAACLLLQLFDSVSPQQALDSLRDLRGPGAIQTIKQYNYLHDFREILATHMLTEGLIARSISR
uniref:protein-tyrosine-phosphatase n=1 Tax=Anolis carolinensis TaxID=28377 RepID=A0A803TF08_ANOCA